MRNHYSKLQDQRKRQDSSDPQSVLQWISEWCLSPAPSLTELFMDAKRELLFDRGQHATWPIS